MAAARPKPDAAPVQAVDLARDVLLADVGTDDVGEYLGHLVEGDRVATHLFACTRTGYRGWHWSVTVVRASRQKVVTVDEVVLIPGEGAIVAPAWLPYRERVQPGDLSPGDLLPVDEEDPRLVPTYLVGDDDPLPDGEAEQLRQVAWELGLGRVRTLSLEGRDQAAQRWYDGEGGPDAPVARAAPLHCLTCGFVVRLAGPLAQAFGVCANGNANDDGRVVSFDHGCGAHSEVQLAKRHLPRALPQHVLDTISETDFEPF